MNNLFICFTPFHLNMAYSIIKKMKYKNNILVYLPSTNNVKNENYFNQSKKYYKDTYSKIIKASYIKDFIYLYNLAKVLQNINIVCVGNLKTLYSRILLSLVAFNKVCTFDDGVGHFYKSPYFSNTKEKLIGKILLHKKFYYYYLLSKVEIHFTVYPNKSIKHKTIKLHYNSVCDYSKFLKNTNKYNLFLSRTFSEDGNMSYETESNLYEKIINAEKIDYIQLHPREKKNKTNLPIMNHYLIVEDLVKSGCINQLTGVSSTSFIISI